MAPLVPRTLLVTVVFVCGCQQRVEPPRFALSDAAAELNDGLSDAVAEQVQTHAGTFHAPRPFAFPVTKDKTVINLGQEVYQRRCVQCHGVTGDGNGPVAAVMYPRPRDYRSGIFKFTSTPYGAKPLRSDLIRVVTNGIRGTSMPSFHLLPPDEIEAVVEYVLYLTQRGELESNIVTWAEFEEEVDPEYVTDEAIPVLESLWKSAAGSQVYPLTPEPVFTAEHIARGKVAFLSKGCSKCHGEDGRGQTPDNLAGNLKDTWGHITRAADLTSGMLRGGQRPMDIYRRIYSGINGTPMPGFANALKDEPGTLWDLVAWVLHVSNTRRSGEEHLPGPFSPYVPVVAATGEDASQDAAD